MYKITWLLNYVASNPNATLTYVASDMCLHVHSDASYLSAPKARSRAGAHFFLRNRRFPISTALGPRGAHVWQVGLGIPSFGRLACRIRGVVTPPRGDEARALARCGENLP